MTRSAIKMAWVNLLMIMGFALSSCSVQGISGQPNLGSAALTPAPKLRVGIDPSLPAFASPGATPNTPVGLEVDLINSLAARLGGEVEFVPVEYNNLLKLMAVCRLDAAISAIPIKDDLKAQMILTQPYYTTAHVVVVKKGNLTVTGRESLSGMIVGAFENTPSELEVKKIAGAQPKIYLSYYAAFQDLVNGYIDAVIADQPRGQSYVDVRRNNLKIVGAPFGSIQFGIAVCRDRKDLAQKIDENLGNLKKEGTLDRLVKRWINP